MRAAGRRRALPQHTGPRANESRSLDLGAEPEHTASVQKVNLVITLFAGVEGSGIIEVYGNQRQAGSSFAKYGFFDFIRGGSCMKTSLGKLSTALLAVFVGFSSAAVGAQAQYQKAEPQVDTRPLSEPAEKAPEKKMSGPLVGNIQHNAKHPKKRLGVLNARRAPEPAPLNARLQDQGLNAQVQSSIGIVGVKFVTTTGHPPVINQVFPGTPAAEVGLSINDVIVAVDGVPTAGLSKDEVFDLIVGSPGTSVTLSIRRRGDFHAVTCTRMDINLLTDPRIRRDYLMSM